jgi:hypothetical protein
LLRGKLLENAWQFSPMGENPNHQAGLFAEADVEAKK